MVSNGPLRFVAPADGNIAVELVDVDGRTVARSSEGFMHAGAFISSIDAASLASGSYYYRLFVEGTVSSSGVVVVAH
jgi:hypothetical protein